jgi:ATP-binding cassette subfamily B protein
VNAFDPAVPKNRLTGLFRLLKGYGPTYFVAVASTGIAACSQTFTYLLLRFLVDEVLPGKTPVAVPAIAAGFIGLACIQGTFSFLSGRNAAKTAEGVIKRLRERFFDCVQKLPFSYHDKTPTGDLIERATSDMDSIRKFYADQAIGFGRITLIFAVNFTALVSLSIRLALFSVIVIPFVLGVSVLFFRAISKRYEKYQEQEAVLSTVLQENLTGVRVVKAFARQEFEKERFETVNREKFRRVNGSISLGTYIAFAALVGQLIWPIRFLGRLIVDISSGLVSYDRVMTVIKEEQEPLEPGIIPRKRLKGDLEFRGVSFGYDPDKPILSDISFRAAPGASVALLGSTGSGKTSLANLVPRFYEYTGGSIVLDGLELSGYQRHALRSQIGIVEQEPFLFSRSIRENISYGVPGKAGQEDIEAAARAAAIHEVIAGFPDGYDTVIGEKGVTLSGGQKQRVAIARTILKNPAILILDDSTSSVDMETEAAIRSALERLMVGRTTFIIAHRIQSLMKADLILVFDRGRIVERGTHASLIGGGGMYGRVFDLQTRIETELEKEISGV